MKKAILFDIDGTLLDAYDFVYEALKHTLTVHKRFYPGKQLIQQAMGKPIVEFYQVLLPEADVLKLAQTHREFQEENFSFIKPFPKTIKTLKYLKNAGFGIAAVSNRTGESLRRSLELTKLAEFFDVVKSADDVSNPKPHKEHLLAAMGQLRVKPACSLMVGDTDQDILAGKNAKVKTVGVTYGFLGHEIKKHHPDFIIDDIEELLTLVDRF